MLRWLIALETVFGESSNDPLSKWEEIRPGRRKARRLERLQGLSGKTKLKEMPLQNSHCLPGKSSAEKRILIML